MTDWSQYTVQELAHALRTLPHKILYSWSQPTDDCWTRRSVWEYDHETDRLAHCIDVRGGWFKVRWYEGGRKERTIFFDTLEEAQAFWDTRWMQDGYLLIQSDDGSAEPVVPVLPTQLVGFDWLGLPAIEIAGIIRTIPRLIAYAWKYKKTQYGEGWWVRDDCEEYGCAEAAGVTEDEDGTFRGPPYDPSAVEHDRRYRSLEDAQMAYDRWLVHNGWLLNDVEEGPPKGV